MLMVNYRGSTGEWEQTLRTLPDAVGKIDVEEMREATSEALKAFPFLDPSLIFLFGGSHGGFLVTLLSGLFPNDYRAVVTRNPVIDVASMCVTSDIPDWCTVESGVGEWTGDGMASIHTDLEALSKMRNLSPLMRANEVKAPTLVMIGRQDQRVPPAQGLLYYRCLKSCGVKTRLLVYDDCHSLSKVSNELDNLINSALWFIEHGFIVDNCEGNFTQESKIWMDVQKRSNASHVYLRHVTPAISGRYSCEVSADAPSFHTALVSGDMDVVELPKSRPSITGVKPRYRVGEAISGNCSSPPSRPPANLTWLLNNKEVDPIYVVHFPHSIADLELREPESQRMPSRVGLQFVLGPQHFSRSPGKLKIRCTASIHGLYWQSTEISVEEEKPKLPQVVEGTRPSFYEGHFDGVVVEQEILVVPAGTKVFQDMNSGSTGLQLPSVVLIGLLAALR